VKDWIKYKDRPEFKILDKKSKLYYIIERLENDQIEKKYLEELIKSRQLEEEATQMIHYSTGDNVKVRGPKNTTAIVKKNKIKQNINNEKNSSKARETERSRYASKITEDKMLQLLRKFNQIQLENAFGSVLMAYHNQDQEEKANQQVAK
jgi:hypothetical protein